MELPIMCLTEKQKDEIVQKYQSKNITSGKLGKIFGASSSCVLRLLHQKNIPVRKIGWKSNRKYTLNENYFDIIDTEEKAYFLGLLYADGYNSEKYGCVALVLQEEDKHILDTFNKQLCSKRPLIFFERSKIKNHKNVYKLSIHSRHITQKLKALGCHQKKSFTITFPNDNQVPPYLLSHFIRGMIDGDGSFGRYGKARYVFCLSSTKQFNEQFAIILKTKLNINSTIRARHPKKNTTSRDLYIYGRVQVYKFLDWVYSNATVYLERKYNRYKRLNIVPKPRIRGENGRFLSLDADHSAA